MTWSSGSASKMIFSAVVDEQMIVNKNQVHGSSFLYCFGMVVCASITVFILDLQITVPCGNAGIYIGKTDAAGRGVWCSSIGNWRHLTANPIIFYDKLVKARMFNRSDGSLGRMTVSGDVDECFTCNRYQAVAGLRGGCPAAWHIAARPDSK